MFALMASMTTGIPEIDAEHSDLVSIINRIAEAERHRRAADALAALEHFHQELRSHFRREEAYFATVSFPDTAAHAQHHAAVLARLREIITDFDAHTARPGGTATTCFDELLRTVLLQDIQVINWLADHGIRMEST
jgi:hemerythrin-like metal-binding protein